MSGNRIVRIVIYAIELLLLYVLQTTRGLVPEFSGTRPLMLVCAAMMIALFEGDVTGLIFGIAAGLLIDMGGADVLGFHALLLGLLGYAVGTMTMELFKTNLLVAMLSMMLIIPLVCVAEWAAKYVLMGYDGAAYVLKTHYMPKMLYTYLVTPLFYAINRFFALRLSEANG